MPKTKTNTKKSEAAVTWTAREPSSGRRWWAFVLVAYFTPPLTIILLALGNWSAGLLVAAVGVTFFVVYLPRPKIWRYHLNGHVLTVTREHRRGPADEKTIDLRDYHSINVHPAKSRTRAHRSQVVLTLWPKKRFASDVDLYTPGQDGAVYRALSAGVGGTGRE